MNTYGYEDVKLIIARKLMQMEGWKVFGYYPAESDIMTGYYSPASWDGIAEKNGYVLCVAIHGASEPKEILKYNDNPFPYDAKITGKIKKLKQMTRERGASEQEEASAKKLIERLQRKAETAEANRETCLVIGMIPGHMANPPRCNWHIEKGGEIIAKGSGLLKYSILWNKEKFIAKTEEEIRNSIRLRNPNISTADFEASVQLQIKEQNEILKRKKDFATFIGKLDTTCEGGCGCAYEKVTVTEYKKVWKAVETIFGQIKEGQLFQLKMDFNYGKRKGLIYRIHEKVDKHGHTSYYACKLNGKLTKECTGRADVSNHWYTINEVFLTWINDGAIAWCELHEISIPRKVVKMKKKRR